MASSITKQVIIMRTDLNMRKGKMCAQAAHAAMLFLCKKMLDNYEDPASGGIVLHRDDLSSQDESWLYGNFTKIVCQVDSEQALAELTCAARMAGVKNIHIVTDAGATEFHGIPTKTCLALGPDNSERIDIVTNGLKLL